MRVAVLGAGISGLTCARLLSADHSVKVFEREAVPGGLVRCRKVAGSLFHVCGGHVFNTKRADVLEWFGRQFRKDEEFVCADRNSVICMAGGNIVPYPIENHVYYLEPEVQKDIIRDWLGRAARGGDEALSSFSDFLRHRFGETLYRVYFQPYNEKVWRRSLDDVPLDWLEGKLPMPTVEEMIYNNVNRVQEKAFVHSTFWYERSGGSQFLANRLSEGIDIIYNVDVDRVSYDRLSKKWNVFGEDFDAIIFTGNVKDLPRLVDGVDISDFEQEISQLSFHGTTSVFCEIDRTDYSWIYLPGPQYRSHRIICTGNFSKDNNAGELPLHRITGTVEFTDEIGKAEIEDNLSRMPLHPVYLDHEYHPCTYPIQDAGTKGMIADLKCALSPHRFFLTGRFADWEYYNMDAAMGAAMDMARGAHLAQ